MFPTFSEVYRHRSQNLGSSGFASFGYDGSKESTKSGNTWYSTFAHELGGERVTLEFRMNPFRLLRGSQSSMPPFAMSNCADEGI
tara:strand:- start:30 stop:284 length:255 start_codon:yes stop_codon:yes gene_type:complete